VVVDVVVAVVVVLDLPQSPVLLPGQGRTDAHGCAGSPLLVLALAIVDDVGIVVVDVGIFSAQLLHLPSSAKCTL
jgi:hypothetical protein